MAQEFIDIDSGSETIEDLVDKAFYGIRQDIQTGRASIDKITGDEPIRLPDAFSLRPDDYRNWVWTYSTFQFSWDVETGRLSMEVL
jgi:hypothetical protein